MEEVNFPVSSNQVLFLVFHPFKGVSQAALFSINSAVPFLPFSDASFHMLCDVFLDERVYGKDKVW